MHKNILSEAFSEQCNSTQSQIPVACEQKLETYPKKPEQGEVHPGANRDSGVFEDFLSPSHLQEEEKLEEASCLSEEEESWPSDQEEDSSSSCDTDRVLHASLSSLDTEVDISRSVSSLSSLTSSATEEGESEEEELEGAEAEEGSDLDFSNSESDISGSNSIENNSSSFGYHSLLNDLTPDEGTDEGNRQDSDFSKLSLSDDSEKIYYKGPASPTSLHSSDSLDYNNYNIPSSDSDAELQDGCGPDSFKEYESEEENNGSFYYSSSLSLSFETSSSEDENPSDIENKMAETKVKMNDAILSNGREELAFHNRKLKHFKKAKEFMEVMADVNHHHKQPRNDISLSEHKNLNNNNYKFFFNQENGQPIDETSRNKPPTSLPLNESASDDNRFSSSVESPIVDAYEKECQDVPEKMVRELEKENQGKEKEQEEPALKKEKVESKRQELEKEAQMIREDEDDMKVFETIMKEAIKKKEAETHTVSRVTFDLSDDIGVRHRPSPQQRRRERNALRRSLQQSSNNSRDKNRLSSPDLGEFDVYNVETALPKIDWEAIEAHLKATKEEERRRRTDREEIRRKLAMGTDEEFHHDRHIKKPSLQSRLQSGKNLQICFMNETASDCESQCSDTESTQDRIDEMEAIISSKECKLSESEIHSMDFISHQARLQAEARLALAQAKEMARMQMEIEKQSKKKSPITEIVRDSFNKIGFPFPDSKRRMSRQILTDMNVAQLQVIVNDLHTQIENLNEDLVQLLLGRDDLHMEQDSMLVDIEDLTKHLGAKQRPNMDSEKKGNQISKSDSFQGPVKVSPSSKTLRLKAMVKK